MIRCWYTTCIGIGVNNIGKNWQFKKRENKLRLSWAKLKSSLVRVVIEGEIEDTVEIKVVGGWVAR